MKKIVISTLLAAASFSAYAENPQCAANAIAQGKKLLSFHTDGDDRASVDTEVKKLPSLTNPVNKKQKFTVLEVFGDVYKGQYRMRFIYHPMGKECVLMDQEILEISSL